MTHERRSLILSPDEWARWDTLAQQLQAIPSQGPQTTAPTWRTVAKWIGQGKLTVAPSPTCEICGATDNLLWEPDPYAHEINDDDTPVWLCEDCRQELEDDI